MTERLTKDDTYRICVALHEYHRHLMRLIERDSTGWSDTALAGFRADAKEIIETLRKMVPKLAKTDIRYFVNYMD
jgi:hypothetical protein